MSNELKKALRRLNGQKATLIVGRVTAVNQGNRSCSVQPEDDSPEYSEVALQAEFAGSKGIVEFPAVGSQVLMVVVPGYRSFVISSAEVDAIEIVSTEPVLLMGGNESLFNLVSDTLSQVSNLIIDTPAGPGAVNAASKTQIDLIQQRLSKAFK